MADIIIFTSHGKRLGSFFGSYFSTSWLFPETVWEMLLVSCFLLICKKNLKMKKTFTLRYVTNNQTNFLKKEPNNLFCSVFVAVSKLLSFWNLSMFWHFQFEVVTFKFNWVLAKNENLDFILNKYSLGKHDET